MYVKDRERSSRDSGFYGNYRGVVVDNNDPLQKNRCRIRVHSVFDDIPDDILPWAEYADPLMQGQNTSGGSFIPDVGARVWCFFETGDHMQPVYFAGAPALVDGPVDTTTTQEMTPRYGVEYTKNRVFRSTAGHRIEFDDTPGDSRVRVFHKSGSQLIMHENGDVTEIVTGNYRRVVYGNYEEYVDGGHLSYCTGNRDEVTTGNSSEFVSSDKYMAVKGSATTEVASDAKTISGGDVDISSAGSVGVSANGGVKLSSGGLIELDAGGNVDLSGAQVHLNTNAASPTSPTALGDLEFDGEFHNSPENGAVLIEVAGSRAGFDEEGETIPASWPAETSEDQVETPAEVESEDGDVAPLNPSCETITSVNYGYQLSDNYTLGDLSRNAVFPHSVRAQNGLDLSAIVCNLKHLAVNVLEPLRAKYPKIRINSGFRAGSGGSQHLKGQAVDIQIPGASPSQYTAMAAWIVKNVPYDQIIMEHGKSIWIHISYNSTSNRKKRTTYYRGSYSTGLTNYYDGGRSIT